MQFNEKGGKPPLRQNNAQVVDGGDDGSTVIGTAFLKSVPGALLRTTKEERNPATRSNYRVPLTMVGFFFLSTKQFERAVTARIELTRSMWKRGGGTSQ